MKILKNCVILTLGEYEEYKRMKACINELKSTKQTDFIQPPAEEVEAWSSDQDSNRTMTSKNTSTHLTASTNQKMKKCYVVNVANARRNPMTSKPARLNRKPNCRTLEDELTISVKTLLFLVLISILFIIMAFICKGPTYGML